MKIRGNLKVFKEFNADGTVILKTDTEAKKGKILYARDTAGTAIWQDLKVYEVNVTATYEEGALVRGVGGVGRYMALVDDALGSQTADAAVWEDLSSMEGSGGSTIYNLNESIPDDNAPLAVGGILDTYRKASDFRDSNDGTPNQELSAVLDAILFPLIKPTPVAGGTSIQLQGKISGASDSYENISGALISVATSIDIKVIGQFTLGFWNPNKETYYGEANKYDFNLHGVIRNPAALDDPFVTEVMTSTAQESETLVYGLTTHYDDGGVPTDSSGLGYFGEQKHASSVAAKTHLFEYGYPVFVAMLGEQKTNIADITTYLATENLSIVGVEGSKLKILKMVDHQEISGLVYASLKVPYVLVPKQYGKRMTEFFNSTNGYNFAKSFILYDGVDHNDEYVTINIGGKAIKYLAYVYYTKTSHIPDVDYIFLTVK